MNQARGESEQHEAATHLVNPGGQIEDDLELGPDQRHGVLRPPGEAAAEGGVPAAVRPREALQHHGGTLAARERSGRAREGCRGSSAGAPDADQPTDRPNPSPAGASPSAGTQPAGPDYMGAGGREPRPHAGAGREAEPEEEIWCERGERGCGECWPHVINCVDDTYGYPLASFRYIRQTKTFTNFGLSCRLDYV